MKDAASKPSGTDFQRLYDEHGHYTARRVDGSFQHRQVLLEVCEYKIPHLAALLPEPPLHSALEIGCGTGELIAHFPLAKPAIRSGCDISPANITTGQRRYPCVSFHAGDFRQLITQPQFDVVILSDILEHVEDDAAFLRDASLLGSCVLVNLPLECNWLNFRRDYGPDDVSGHLRFYTLENGLDLFARAGLRVTKWQQVWIHELAVEKKRRKLRKDMLGQAYSGNLAIQTFKAMTDRLAAVFPAFGRRLHASTLFAVAERAP